MIAAPPAAPGFGRTLLLLLRTARKRARARRLRQRELLAQRTGRQASTNWGVIGTMFALLVAMLVHILAGFAMIVAIDAAQRVEAERRGRIVVNVWFYQQVKDRDAVLAWDRLHPDQAVPPVEPLYAREARMIAHDSGKDASVMEQQLRETVTARGVAGFVSSRSATPGLRGLARTGRFPLMVGSLVLLLWAAMLVFQGEGLELDIQRRHHPLWEWLLSHPVPQSAVFLAEVLMPLAANPSYWAAPIFPGILYGAVYGPSLGAAAALLVGLPVTVAAACLGKAFEIAIVLRFSPRTRGGILGLMSWLGYATFMFLLVGVVAVPWLVSHAGRAIAPLAVLPWPLLRLFLGGPWSVLPAHAGQPHGFSFLTGVFTCSLLSAAAIACGVGFTVWGAQRGLSGAVADTAPSGARLRRGTGKAPRFGRDPLYRKEVLWFLRDRSALVQAVLIPLTIAGYQLFNLRGVLSRAGGEWNYTCGAVIFFGTYFLWVLGPKSLASEGQALWIALGWPRGLEDLLKAKARLWTLLSSCLVLPVLLWAAFYFRGDVPQIALLAVGWWFFARSMAEKSVTLVTVSDSSGEPQPQNRSRRSGAQLGMLTFALGVVTRQWHIAMLGIVFSWITAAAMWQNFRARLPYLYDPWSEKLPLPPTLMHAMVAISLMVESSAVLMTGAVAFLPKLSQPAAPALAYALSATLVFLGTTRFFYNRGVVPNQVWTWMDGAPALPRQEQSLEMYLAEPELSWAERYGLAGPGLPRALLMAVALGLALGGFGTLYTIALEHIPSLAPKLQASHQAFAGSSVLRISYAVMAVGFAPFAEEYLFRGLLFRALDREWGGWRALAGAAAFFTVYHPVLAWPPVFLVGLVNCMLFKATRRLLPCILVHMIYNAVIVWR